MIAARPVFRPVRSNSYRPTLERLLLFVIIMLIVMTVAPSSAQAADQFASTATIDSILNHSIVLKDKVVYVDFWASWCTPCRHSFPRMKELADKYAARGFQIVTVNLDKKHADAEKFLRETQTAFQVVFDSTGSVAKLFKVDAMPTSFLYGRDGQLQSRFRGFKDDEFETLDSTINSLVNKGNSK